MYIDFQTLIPSGNSLESGAGEQAVVNLYVCVEGGGDGHSRVPEYKEKKDPCL